MAKWWDFLRFRRETTDSTSGTSAEATPRTPRTGGGLYVYGMPDYAAMNIATAYRCAKVLSDSVACLRLQFMTRRGGRYVEDEKSPFHYLLTVQPQPEKSIVDFWTEAILQILHHGNAYIYPRRIMGEVTDLVLCAPLSVTHDSTNMKYTVCDQYNGVYGTFGEEEMIHLFLYSDNGRDGVSVLTHAAQAIRVAGAGDTETGNRFVNGGSVRGIVSNGNSTVGFGEYQDSELEKTAESIDDRFRNGEKIVSLPGQVGFQQISLSSTDMQFLESRKFTVREICRFYGVHPSFVFDDSSSNYKSAEMANVAFLSMSLNPILRRIEAEFNRKLVSRSQCCKYIFQFDRKGIYSLDLLTKADYQLKTLQSGIYSVNDWRRMENQPEIEGGDKVYISTNLMPIG